MASRTASSVTAAACLLLALAHPARADEPSANDKNLAQSLFDQARALMDQGRYADACPRFADSERLDPGGGTILNLALCYDKLGKIALAYNTYNEAISLSITEHRREREKFARDRAAALAPRLPRLTLKLTDAPPTADVRLDGTRVPDSALGTAMAVDPGEHTIDATASDRAPWKLVLSVAEGEARDVPITLAALPPVASAPTPIAPPPARVLRAPAPESPLQYEHHRSTAFYVLGGVAIASLATSAVTGAVAWSAHESAGQKCSASTGFCADPTGIDDASRARTMAWISTATLGVGVLTGVVAFVLPLDERVKVVPIQGGAAISLQGTWR
jgi:hypothetical protein